MDVISEFKTKVIDAVDVRDYCAPLQNLLY